MPNPNILYESSDYSGRTYVMNKRQTCPAIRMSGYEENWIIKTDDARRAVAAVY